MLEPQQAVDLLIYHQIMLGRYTNDVVRRIMTVLNEADKDLFSRLAAALDDAPGAVSGQAAYLQSMLESTRAMNAAAYSKIQSAVQADLFSLAAVEVAFNDRLYAAMAGRVPLASVGVDSAYAAAMSKPFSGILLKESFPELGEARMRRLRSAVRTGFVTGKTTTDIVRELRGTKEKGFKDGLIELDRAHLTTVVHSAIGHTAATARSEFMKTNADVIKSQVWLSTLDGRTSKTCIAHSNKRYTTGEAPAPIGHAIPWGTGPGRIHFRCRSVAIGLLAGQTELYGTRSSSDGQIDANTSYEDWMKRQVDFTQDEILGAKRAKLFRDGGLSLDRFSDDKGKWLSLADLKKLDAEAFKRAGI